MIRTYYLLTKPGIIMGNAIAMIAGFLLASRGQVNLGLFAATFVGLCLIIGSACVFNNYLDRNIDRKMARTKSRALAKGAVAGSNALIFATILGLAGTITLALWTNFLALSVALFGFLIYVVVYGYFKRHSVYGTLVGSISGAVPPVVGYCAAGSRFDLGAIILFLILVLWQMPHFYAIAIFRLKDYQAAGIPVRPAVKGVASTKLSILLYTAAFLVVSMMLTLFGYTGYAYLAVAAILGLVWLWLSYKGFRTTDDVKWARGVFRFSLVVLMGVSVMISADWAVR